MENSDLKKRIQGEMNKVISASCSQRLTTQEFNNLHVALVKRYYNAANVTIDYHRKRVVMDVILDDALYNPKTINVNLPTFKANLLYSNLKDFLKSCLEKDSRSMAFYARLLASLKQRSQRQLLTVA